jgi:hypothetical protein
MSGIGAFGQTFHGSLLILKSLEMNRKDRLFELITRPDGASLILKERVHRAPLDKPDGGPHGCHFHHSH